MVVITLHDIAEILVWICIILFFVWLGSGKKQDKTSKDEKSKSKGGDNE